jgi:protein phosphatase
VVCPAEGAFVTDRSLASTVSFEVVRTPSRAFSSRITIDVAAQSHPGRVRPNNEDQFFVAKLTRTLETMLASLPPGAVPDREDETNYVMVVADGMGGHAAGEVASRLAIGGIVSRGLDLPDWFFKLDERGMPVVERRARELLQQIGAEIIERGRQDAALRGMGTTLTAARSYGRDLLIVHIGDSRAYLYRGRRLLRLTKDHTFVQLLVDRGQLTPEEAARSKSRHILTNVLGGSTERVEVDVDLLHLENGDRVLLCSDGLTDLVNDETISRTLGETRTSVDACARLVQQALDNGGHDNVTAVVAAYSIPEDPPAA